MDPRIHDLIEAKQIKAIALDTSIFDAQQRRLEDGLLRRVEQFRSSPNVRVLIPDVVQRELTAHLTRDAAEARTALLRATRAPALADVLPIETIAQLRATAAQAMEPGVAAAARLTHWRERTDATVLDVAARVDLRTLFDRYFAAHPPFADAGDKKHEFPDAAALLALEHWADEHSTGILVVSSDGDWQRFCAESTRLYWTPDLSDVLGAFQDETARFAARRLAELSRPGGPLNLADALFRALSAQSGAIDVQVEARSDFPYGLRDVIDMQRVALPTLEVALNEFEAVDYGDGAVTVAVHCTAHGRITIVCAFGAWHGDGPDGTYVELGTRIFTIDAAIPIRALVTLTGDIPNRMTIGAVEILPAVYRVELGEIGPDWQSLLGDNLTPPRALG
ncbi:hypothetical protein BLA18110_07969 [Burkholderia lata]|uniref:PIN domain-containing protein n=1 Tax=Burkholderia lata (strain ATCC 17760 / DSM 23089 / LMG 22485 / NCIMB 9086 / R18194 / 383) TaxID=482957 RepID=UPI001452BB69|nr:PIN domain-containing protein [Burkholderia lata]VWD54740.1 hypothetical protein BLA18110_07969 [Burkholderia lata]